MPTLARPRSGDMDPFFDGVARQISVSGTFHHISTVCMAKSVSGVAHVCCQDTRGGASKWSARHEGMAVTTVPWMLANAWDM